MNINNKNTKNTKNTENGTKMISLSQKCKESSDSMIV